jgi:uncharacterized protein (TIGR03083 family)
MDYADHVAAVERESAALADALHAGRLDAPVPSCPGWTLADLALHAGQFSVFWTHVLCEGLGRPKTPYPGEPEGEGRREWFDELRGHLVAVLRETPPDTGIWTWVDSDKSARFAARRAANELAIHRVDAQLARGEARPVDAALAADGIEEIFVMMAALPRSGQAKGETMHLHGTDRGDEWLVTLTPDGVRVERTHSKGDLALRGAVSDLELVLYQRPPIGEVQRFGDDAVLDAWYREFTFG